ncbi:putative uncharacterized protein DDB_G0282133 [Dendronephthya gigantea]|uniref:putative uncharacterized protein DDB_G0282133 n=1 Tax=Dendronephthya gigantea TaxID=151771 RepID=UPI00106C1E60|nr:putative uncharacterized protein DDB_G0282133 [Dendronephthya gigantea]
MLAGEPGWTLLYSRNRHFLYCVLVVLLVCLQDTVIADEERCSESTLRDHLRKSFKVLKLGRTRNIRSCINLCCSSRDCELAILRNSRCYGIACSHHDLCRGIVNGLRKKRHEIAKRSISDTDDDIQSDFSYHPRNHGFCRHKRVVPHQVFIEGGRGVSVFHKLATDVRSKRECNEYCCHRKDCSLAFILREKCYGVICPDDGDCESGEDRRLPLHLEIALIPREGSTGETSGIGSSLDAESSFSFRRKNHRHNEEQSEENDNLQKEKHLETSASSQDSSSHLHHHRYFHHHRDHHHHHAEEQTGSNEEERQPTKSKTKQYNSNTVSHHHHYYHHHHKSDMKNDDSHISRDEVHHKRRLRHHHNERMRITGHSEGKDGRNDRNKVHFEKHTNMRRRYHKRPHRQHADRIEKLKRKHHTAHDSSRNSKERGDSIQENSNKQMNTERRRHTHVRMHSNNNDEDNRENEENKNDEIRSRHRQLDSDRKMDDVRSKTRRKHKILKHRVWHQDENDDQDEEAMNDEGDIMESDENHEEHLPKKHKSKKNKERGFEGEDERARDDDDQEDDMNRDEESQGEKKSLVEGHRHEHSQPKEKRRRLHVKHDHEEENDDDDRDDDRERSRKMDKEERHYDKERKDNDDDEESDSKERKVMDSNEKQDENTDDGMEDEKTDDEDDMIDHQRNHHHHEHNPEENDRKNGETEDGNMNDHETERKERRKKQQFRETDNHYHHHYHHSHEEGKSRGQTDENKQENGNEETRNDERKEHHQRKKTKKNHRQQIDDKHFDDESDDENILTQEHQSRKNIHEKTKKKKHHSVSNEDDEDNNAGDQKKSSKKNTKNHDSPNDDDYDSSEEKTEPKRRKKWENKIENGERKSKDKAVERQTTENDGEENDHVKVGESVRKSAVHHESHEDKVLANENRNAGDEFIKEGESRKSASDDKTNKHKQNYDEINDDDSKQDSKESDEDEKIKHKDNESSGTNDKKKKDKSSDDAEETRREHKTRYKEKAEGERVANRKDDNKGSKRYREENGSRNKKNEHRQDDIKHHDDKENKYDSDNEREENSGSKKHKKQNSAKNTENKKHRTRDHTKGEQHHKKAKHHREDNDEKNKEELDSNEEKNSERDSKNNRESKKYYKDSDKLTASDRDNHGDSGENEDDGHEVKTHKKKNREKNKKKLSSYHESERKESSDNHNDRKIEKIIDDEDNNQRKLDSHRKDGNHKNNDGKAKDSRKNHNGSHSNDSKKLDFVNDHNNGGVQDEREKNERLDDGGKGEKLSEDKHKSNVHKEKKTNGKTGKESLKHEDDIEGNESRNNEHDDESRSEQKNDTNKKENRKERKQKKKFHSTRDGHTHTNNNWKDGTSKGDGKHHKEKNGDDDENEVGQDEDKMSHDDGNEQKNERKESGEESGEKSAANRKKINNSNEGNDTHSISENDEKKENENNKDIDGVRKDHVEHALPLKIGKKETDRRNNELVRKTTNKENKERLDEDKIQSRSDQAKHFKHGVKSKYDGQEKSRQLEKKVRRTGKKKGIRVHKEKGGNIERKINAIEEHGVDENEDNTQATFDDGGNKTIHGKEHKLKNISNDIADIMDSNEKSNADYPIHKPSLYHSLKDIKNSTEMEGNNDIMKSNQNNTDSRKTDEDEEKDKTKFFNQETKEWKESYNSDNVDESGKYFNQRTRDWSEHQEKTTKTDYFHNLTSRWNLDNKTKPSDFGKYFNQRTRTWLDKKAGSSNASNKNSKHSNEKSNHSNEKSNNSNENSNVFNENSNDSNENSNNTIKSGEFNPANTHKSIKEAKKAKERISRNKKSQRRQKPSDLLHEQKHKLQPIIPKIGKPLESKLIDNNNRVSGRSEGLKPSGTRLHIKPKNLTNVKSTPQKSQNIESAEEKVKNEILKLIGETPSKTLPQQRKSPNIDQHFLNSHGRSSMNISTHGDKIFITKPRIVSKPKTILLSPNNTTNTTPNQRPKHYESQRILHTTLPHTPRKQKVLKSSKSNNINAKSKTQMKVPSPKQTQITPTLPKNKKKLALRQPQKTKTRRPLAFPVRQLKLPKVIKKPKTQKALNYLRPTLPPVLKTWKDTLTSSFTPTVSSIGHHYYQNWNKQNVFDNEWNNAKWNSYYNTYGSNPSVQTPAPKPAVVSWDSRTWSTNTINAYPNRERDSTTRRLLPTIPPDRIPNGDRQTSGINSYLNGGGVKGTSQGMRPATVDKKGQLSWDTMGRMGTSGTNQVNGLGKKPSAIKPTTGGINSHGMDRSGGNTPLKGTIAYPNRGEFPLSKNKETTIRINNQRSQKILNGVNVGGNPAPAAKGKIRGKSTPRRNHVYYNENNQRIIKPLVNHTSSMIPRKTPTVQPMLDKFLNQNRVSSPSRMRNSSQARQSSRLIPKQVKVLRSPTAPPRITTQPNRGNKTWSTAGIHHPFKVNKIEPLHGGISNEKLYPKTKVPKGCYPGEIMSEMTLENGLDAGNYTNLGVTALMDGCISKCCGISSCEVAIQMDNVCFALKCHSKESCKIKTTLGKSSHHKLCFISRKKKERQNIFDFDNDILGEQDVCHEEQAVGLKWGTTNAGSFHEIPCPKKAKGLARRKCSLESHWLLPDFSACVSNEYENLYRRAKRLVYGEDSSSLLRSLTLVTTRTIDNSLIFGGDLKKTTEIMTSIIQEQGEKQDGRISQKDLKNYLTICSNMLDDSNKNEWRNIQKDGRGSADLLRDSQTYALLASSRLPETLNNGTYLTNNIVVQMSHHEQGSMDKIFPDYKNTDVAMWDGEKDNVRLPASVFSIGNIKTVTFSYKTLPALLPTSSNENFKHSEPNSKILATIVEPAIQDKITPAVTITLHHLKQNRQNPKCVFWDFNLK